MANPVKAEVRFEAGGQSYVYKFGTYAMAVLEKKVGMSTKKWFDSRGGDDKKNEKEWGAGDMLVVFFAALSQHQPDLTDAQVADILDEIGFEKAGEIVKEGAGLSSPKGDAGGDQGPRKGARAKTT